MHSIRRLCRGERAAELPGDGHDGIVGERTAGAKQRVERQAVHEIRRDEGNTAILTDLAQSHDVAVREANPSGRASPP